MFCSHCGKEIAPDSRFCPQCGAPLAPGGAPRDAAERKVLAGLFGILLGSLGIHKFYLGLVREGVIEILLTIFSCGILGFIGFIEGIIYLTKSDEAFYQDYIVNRKPWF